jgi:hypothetical protein
MNQLLQNRYNELGSEEITQLRHRLKDSPKALKLIDLLENRRKRKINTVDAVEFLYGDSEETFEVLRNRFFKLRKQLLGLMETRGNKGNGNSVQLLPLEEKLYRSRQLIAENHFQLARTELRALAAECKKLNVFEVLPEAINQLIYCNLAMNLLHENDHLVDELTEASALLDEFRQMQALSRKAYLSAIARNQKNITKATQQMRRITIRRAAYPRFKILYHFTVFSYWAGVPGATTKSSARHLTALKKLTEKHPGMPAGYYEPNAPALMQFYLLMGEGTHLFMKGNINGCYELFRDAWEIQERTPNLRIRRSESHYLNRAAIEIATGRYRDALKTAEDLIEFQKEQRQEEKRLKGYAEIAVIYSYAWPTLKCPNPEFIAGQLKTLASVMRRNNSPGLADVLSTQAIFHFFMRDWKTANKLITDEKVRKVFTDMDVDVYIKTLELSPKAPAEKIDAIKAEVAKQLHSSVSADRVFSLKRVQNMLKLLEEDRG